MVKAKDLRVPFTILIDSNESAPFSFLGLRADADGDYGELIVPTKFQALGRFPHGRGDYSIEGYENDIGVERKSLEDIQGTVLGWDSEDGAAGRRERHKQLLHNLALMPHSAVVIEATLGECMREMPSYGVKSIEVNRKIFFRSVMGMQVDYRVPWFWCDDRRTAENLTYRLLARAYRKMHE